MYNEGLVRDAMVRKSALEGTRKRRQDASPEARTDEGGFSRDGGSHFARSTSCLPIVMMPAIPASLTAGGGFPGRFARGRKRSTDQALAGGIAQGRSCVPTGSMLVPCRAGRG